MITTKITKQIRIATCLLFSFIILTGLIYPFIITGIAQLFFPWKANGSLITQNNKIIGSQLIGQAFDKAYYFWGRPSATTSFPYNAENSSGSNLGPSNPLFLKAVKERVAYLQQFNQLTSLIPVDLVTTSASGLDPEISPLAAYYQISRVAKARNISEQELIKLVQSQIQPRTFKIFGEPRINVLQLNLALDQQSKGYSHERKSTSKS